MISSLVSIQALRLASLLTLDFNMLRTIRHADAGKPDVWIDLLSPTAPEIARVEREFDITVADLTPCGKSRRPAVFAPMARSSP